jgi:methionyl-tRNA formyltransferase
MGTPDFSVPILSAILRAGHEVVAVYSRAPRPSGRGMTLRPSPVQIRAESAGIPVYTPRTLRAPEETLAFKSLAADVAVVVAYGLILPKPILEGTRFGCFNVHASLLPRWRGAAPIQRAVMAGDSTSGVTIMLMNEGLDTGPVAMERPITIAPDMTSGELHDRLSVAGAEMIVEALAALSRGELQTRAQPSEGVTYAKKIEKAECRIDWALPSKQVHDHIRGLSPTPGAFFEADFGGGVERLKVLRAQRADSSGPVATVLDDQLTIGCGDGSVRLLEIQRPGKAVVSATEFLRGVRNRRGRLLI